MAAGLMLFAYLALSSIYLQTLLSHRDGAMELLEPEIQDGLGADSEARAFEARRDALLELWSARTDTQLLWAGVALALQSRANVSRIDIRDGRISLSGDAPDASEILAAIASTPEFSDVTFDSPVRAGRSGRQNFSLSFALTGAGAGSGNENE